MSSEQCTWSDHKTSTKFALLSFSLKIARDLCATFFFCVRFITTFHRLSFSFPFSYPESYSFRNFLSLISQNTLLSSTLNGIIRYYKWFFSFCDLFALIFLSGFFSFLKQKKKNKSFQLWLFQQQYSTSFLVDASRKMRPRFRA